MTTPTEARQRRYAARQPHLRREMADLLIKWRIYMRVHQADIVETMRAWERLADTERSMWTYQATSDMHRDQVRRLQCELAAVTAERDALRQELDAMQGEL